MDSMETRRLQLHANAPISCHPSSSGFSLSNTAKSLYNWFNRKDPIYLPSTDNSITSSIRSHPITTSAKILTWHDSVQDHTSTATPDPSVRIAKKLQRMHRYTQDIKSLIYKPNVNLVHRSKLFSIANDVTRKWADLDAVVKNDWIMCRNIEIHDKNMRLFEEFNVKSQEVQEMIEKGVLMIHGEVDDAVTWKDFFASAQSALDAWTIE